MQNGLSQPVCNDEMMGFLENIASDSSNYVKTLKDAKNCFKIAKGALAKARRKFDEAARALTKEMVERNEQTSSDEDEFENQIY